MPSPWRNKTTDALVFEIDNFYVGISHDLHSETAKDAMHLRHEVFCLECGFEPVQADEVEHDAYDQNAIHLVVYARDTQLAVGCARLLHTHPLPSSRYLATDSRWWPPLFAPDTATEISRLVVKKSSRGGVVLLLLIFAMTCVAQRQRYEVGYASMESRLTKFISMLHGLIVTKISDDFEFRGMRSVSLLTFSEFYDNALQALIHTGKAEALNRFLQGAHVVPTFQSKEA